MKTLSASTEDFIRVARSTLTADAVAGTNVTLNLADNNALATGDFIVIGREGSEQAEMAQINQAVSGATTVRVATLKFNHLQDEPVVKFRYDKRKFYGATAADGVFTELTADGSPKAIQVDVPTGATLEYTSNTYTYFKATYYNSQTAEETDIADSTPALADESLRYCSLYAIRKHAGLTENPFITDGRLETKRLQAENEINSALFARYILPLSSIPAIVSQICELLAAGYIDYEEFGADGQGVKWLGEARAILKQITAGTRRLLDSSYQELARNTKTGVLDGYPNDTETDAAQFSMSDRF
jgi:phage gp36-like protein